MLAYSTSIYTIIENEINFKNLLHNLVSLVAIFSFYTCKLWKYKQSKEEGISFKKNHQPTCIIKSKNYDNLLKNVTLF